ncbi:CYTH domain-containing protein [Bacillus kexueae]|uniref:CYTH domain-containing protein n=1 Tax=Aeribacillus kexueae TaxID=2078952 RepID=UPI001FAF98D1|nr:CYTH domain-containing protein [Bacillus kexueae]
MNQEIEIEFKNLLTKDEFDRFVSHFNLTDASFFTQENHYFDTPSFSLKDKGAALRIRKKNGRYTLTLKQPAPVGLLETHQPLSEQEFKVAINDSKLPQAGDVMDKLKELHIAQHDLQFFGTLTTDRAEISHEKGLIVLDWSRYLKKEDFELEFEVQDEAEGKQAFLQLLDTFNIPLRKTENKIKRFYLAKYEHSMKESN